MICDAIEELETNERDDIIAFCDNDKNKQGKLFRNIGVISPNKLRGQNYDLLVISNQYKREIRNQIIKEGIASIDKTVDYEIYHRTIFAKKQYIKRYSEYNDIVREAFDYPSITVYTAIIGDYDQLIDPLFLDRRIKYICFTNNRDICSQKWEVRYINTGNIMDVMLARKLKIMPWEYMECSNPLIWVDANFLVKGNLINFVQRYKREKSILCFPHGERTCICDETAAIVLRFSDLKSRAIMQTAKYMSEGMPLDYGLFETGCFYRDLNDSNVKEIMIKWWQEIEKNTYRDQISLPYVCWKNDYLPDICDRSIYYNEWLEYNNHKNQKTNIG